MRLIIWVIVLYLIYRVVKGLFAVKRQGQRTVNGDEVEELVQDAYCKMYVPRRDSVKRIVRGQTDYFCSEECARRYELERGKG